METRILYIDDDLALASLVKRNLGRASHDVTHTHDPEIAISYLREQSFDVIVLDHYLSNMTGHDMLKRFQELGIGIPVVYITGSHEARIAIDALKSGASDYVLKSVSEDFFPLLVDAINQTVSNARLREAKARADEETRLAKERAEALLAEMNHRVANSLALVAGLLRLQANNSGNPEVKEALEETQARISAIAGMHRSLYTTDDVRNVEMQPYLNALVKDITATAAKGSSTSITIDVDRILLPADKAVSAGMIVTELVTNALKYAYSESQPGEIRVLFKQSDETSARLAVEDDGVGVNAAQPSAASTGLGRKIVKTMADTIGSGIRYPETDRGTVAEVIVALAKPE
jgi:two-component sensor histidine kinase